MCYKPLHIKNRKIDSNPFRDSLLLDVPCGHCSQCEHGKVLEWTTRAYYEYLDNRSHGGATLYLTLTYNNQNLPYYDGRPCFSKRDCQLFLKRLRKDFKLDNIKYFLTSEYGGLKKRPHYHMLLYIPKRINYLGLLQRLEKIWSNGFVHQGAFGLFVTGFGAISYCAKYLVKDIDFDYDTDKSVRPFHLQSKGFGACMIDQFQLYDLSSPDTFRRLVDGCVLLPDPKTGYKKVFIPQYVSRKILYDLEYEEVDGKKVPRWYINEYGCKVRRAKFEEQVNKTAQRFKDLYNNIENIIYDSERLEVFNRNTHQNFATSVAIRLQFDKTDFKEIALYVGMYKGLAVSTIKETDTESIGVDIPLFSPFAVQYILDAKFGEQTPDIRDVVTTLSKKADYIRSDMEYLLSLLNGLYYVKGYYAEKAEIEKRKLNSQLKLLHRA